jgi:CSLREA domain-containing protein
MRVGGGNRTCSALAAAFAITVMASALPALANAATITPNVPVDQFGNDPDSCSLREAVQSANTDSAFGGCSAGAGADVIALGEGTFQLSIPGDEDANAQGDLDTTGSLSILHSGIDASGVNGGDLDRVFDLQGNSQLALSGFAVSGGAATAGGGGIRNPAGNLLLSEVTLLGNTAPSNGGALLNGGTAFLSNVTVSGNASSDNGGGIRNNGTIALKSATLSANTANSDGAGGGDGGGISSATGAITTLGSTIVASNSVGSGGAGADCSGTTGTAGHNLLGSTAGCGINPLTIADFADIVNQDALLEPLAENGGPTPTVAFALTSPALGKGGKSCTAIDQRGVTRVPGGCDIGAYELTKCQGGIVNRVGTEGDDTLYGTELADAFLLLGGKDIASGLGGNDRFCGAGGNDTMIGGDGDDRGFGSGGRDTFRGGKGRDFAGGGAGNDALRGGPGPDRLKGGSGSDKLKGQRGTDRCNGGSGRDRAFGCETKKRLP